MKLQLTRPLVSFDLETTGKDTATARIIEMAFFKLLPDGSTDKLHRFVNPEMPIPPDSIAVHGITDEQVADQPTFKQVADEVLAFLKGSDLLGFNCIMYDVPVLWYELQRVGHDWNHTEHHVVDAGNIYKMVAPRTLVAAVAEYCRRDHTGAHSAFHDASATTDVLLEQLERHTELPVTIQELAIQSNHGRKRADVTGKFIVDKNGEYVLNFGQNRGQLARDNRSFLSWMLSKDFPRDARAICQEACIGPFCGHRRWRPFLMNNPESRLQQACIVWFSYAHRKLWDTKRLHAIPNGGLRSRKTAGILKAEGAQAGVWDLHLTIPRGDYAGLWIESKAGKNGLTDEQKAFRESHEGLYQFAVVRTVDEFIKAITDYLNLSIKNETKSHEGSIRE